MRAALTIALLLPPNLLTTARVAHAEPAEETLRAAISSLCAGDAQTAADQLLRVLAQQPQNPVAHLGVAVAALALGDDRAASTECLRAAELCPEDALPHNLLGLWYLSHAMPSKAQTEFREAVRLEPGYTQARMNLGLSLCLSGSPGLAIGECFEAQRSNPKDLFLNEVEGMAFCLSGDYDSAIRVLRGALERGPASEATPNLLPRPLLPAIGDSKTLRSGFEKSSPMVAGTVWTKLRSLAKEQGEGADTAGTANRLDNTSSTEKESVSGTTAIVASFRVSNEIRYVAFSVDGVVRSVTNTRPYRWTWDTSREEEGEHNLLVRAYGQGGVVLSQEERSVRVRNSTLPPPAIRTEARAATPAGAEAPALQSKGLAACREDLRKLATLQGSLLNCRYVLAKSYQAKGLSEFALAEYCNVFLEEPDYLDARKELLRLRGGIPPALNAVPVTEFQAVETPYNVVALTFDDGPRPFYTPQILRTLQSRGAKATFFVVGEMAEAHPDLLREICAWGHEVGNHTYSHVRLDGLPVADIERQLLQTETVVKRVVDRRTCLFRPPGGHYTAQARQALQELGYKAVFWQGNITSYEDLEPEEIAVRLAQGARRGSILLLHNGKDKTVYVLPKLLDELAARGLRGVTISELLSLATSVTPRTFASL